MDAKMDTKMEDARTSTSNSPDLKQEMGQVQTLHVTEEQRQLDEALERYTPGSVDEQRLVRKLDLIMLPALWWMYILAYVDRTNIANAKAAGMATDLSLSDSEYAWIISIFFIGYLCFEVPSNLVLTRTRPSWYLSGIMMVWGTIVAAMSRVKTAEALLAIRFLIGAVEAGFFPGVLYIMTCFYKKQEIGKRFCLFFTASCISGALGGIMAGAVTGHMDGLQGMEGWRWLFLIEGVVTVFFAIVVKFILLDFPGTSKRLSAEERQLAVVRLIHDRKIDAARSQGSLKPWEAVKAAFADPRTYLFLVLFVLDLGSCTISYFIPTILKDMGYESVTAQWMTVPIWMTGAVFLVVLPYTADRFNDRRWHNTGCLSLAFICCIVCIATKNAVVRYIMLCFFIGGLYTALPLILNWTSETIALPNEKRAVVVALVNSVGNLSAVYGSHLWPSKDKPTYKMGFAVTAAFCGTGAVLAALIPVILRYLPKEGQTRAEQEILRQSQERRDAEGN